MKACERLRAWRKSKGLSQVQAARLAGISQSAWWEFESGTKEPSIGFAAKLSRVTKGRFHVAVEDWAA